MSKRARLTFLFSSQLVKDIGLFMQFLRGYSKKKFYLVFRRFEILKDAIVDLLYKDRGRYVRPFMHVGTIGLVFAVITLGPVIFRSDDPAPPDAGAGVLTANAFDSFTTQYSSEVQQYRGGEVITHTVAEDETLADVAARYSLSEDTIIWENDLKRSAELQEGQILSILPVDGVRHKVNRGETIYSVGKKYGLDTQEVQRIVDYPFNEFRDDEFSLVTGQFILVPGGVPKSAGVPQRTFAPVVQFTPGAGALTGSGSYVWPAGGRITQGYAFYHKAIDIANQGGGSIIAADGGTVVVAGWVDNSGYGNRVIIDHNNGDLTLYAHLSAVQVQVGQTVNRGDVVGQMGSTGRSTGVHLHFEIRRSGQLLNPLGFLN